MPCAQPGVACMRAHQASGGTRVEDRGPGGREVCRRDTTRYAAPPHIQTQWRPGSCGCSAAASPGADAPAARARSAAQSSAALPGVRAPATPASGRRHLAPTPGPALPATGTTARLPASSPLGGRRPHSAISPVSGRHASCPGLQPACYQTGSSDGGGPARRTKASRPSVLLASASVPPVLPSLHATVAQLVKPTRATVRSRRCWIESAGMPM